MKVLAKIAVITLLMSACAEEKKSSSDEANVESDSRTKIEVVGTLTLDSTIPAEDADDLEPGGQVANATVFLKDYPDIETTSDSTGTFTLAIETTDLELQSDGERNFTIAMWYTTPKKKTRFGTLEDFSAAEGDVYSLGTVSLTYTNAIHFHFFDSKTEEMITSECDLEVSGFEDKVPVVKIGPGKIDTDYLPAADYDVSYTCEGYASGSKVVTVSSAYKSGAWMTEKIYLDPQ